MNKTTFKQDLKFLLVILPITTFIAMITGVIFSKFITFLFENTIGNLDMYINNTTSVQNYIYGGYLGIGIILYFVLFLLLAYSLENINTKYLNKKILSYLK